MLMIKQVVNGMNINSYSVEISREISPDILYWYVTSMIQNPKDPMEYQHLNEI